VEDSPAFRSLDATGLWDWHYFHHMWEAGVVALSRFGEWPLWDPFHCGGVTIFGNPQNQLLAPLYFLSFLIGPTLATKLWVVLHAAAGFSGMILFARREGRLEWPGALLAAVAWGASGFFAWHGARGHSALLPFYYAPWLLLAWRGAARDPRWTAGVAALLGLVLLEGGGYPFAFFLLLLGFDALVRLASGPGRGRILVAGLVAAPLTLLLGAVRLLPVVDQMLGRPRTQHFADALSASEVLGMLTVREHGLLHAGHRYLWTEYGSYVGWGVVALALLGAGVARRRGRIQWVLGLVAFLGFTVGHYGPWSPWELLQRLPLYESLRVPSRFAVLFTFYLALLAGLGLDALGRALAVLPARRRLRRRPDHHRSVEGATDRRGPAGGQVSSRRPVRIPALVCALSADGDRYDALLRAHADRRGRRTLGRARAPGPHRGRRRIGRRVGPHHLHRLRPGRAPGARNGGVQPEPRAGLAELRGTGPRRRPGAPGGRPDARRASDRAALRPAKPGPGNRGKRSGPGAHGARGALAQLAATRARAPGRAALRGEGRRSGCPGREAP
jgi:hypothetical protein